MSVAVTPSRTSHRLRRLLLSVLAVVVLFVGALELWFWWDGTSTFIGFEPDGADLLDEVIARSGLPTDEIGDVETRNEDGAQPETAEVPLKLSLTSSQIEAAIKQSCTKLKLNSPTPASKYLEPDLICDGNWGRYSVSVHVSTRCGQQCTAFVQTRARVRGF